MNQNSLRRVHRGKFILLYCQILRYFVAVDVMSSVVIEHVAFDKRFAWLLEINPYFVVGEGDSQSTIYSIYENHLFVALHYPEKK